MKSLAAGIGKYCLFICSLLACVVQVKAQTDADAIMMAKNNFCVGGMYSYSSWKNYWEGTLKRDNQNLGTVSTKMIGVMGNYGISKKLNVLFGIPYVQTKASAGTLHGQKRESAQKIGVRHRRESLYDFNGIADGDQPCPHEVSIHPYVRRMAGLTMLKLFRRIFSREAA